MRCVVHGSRMWREYIIPHIPEAIIYEWQHEVAPPRTLESRVPLCSECYYRVAVEKVPYNSILWGIILEKMTEQGDKYCEELYRRWWTTAR